MTYLRHDQVKELKHEISVLEAKLGNSNIQDKGAVRRQLGVVESQLRSASPPELTGDERDKVAKRAKALLDEIVVGMPSSEEMRKKPPGAVGKHMRWEKANKAKIMEYKNCLRALEPENDDPDLANIERFRPRASTLNMQNADIPGQQYFVPPNTQAWRDGWDRTFGNGESGGEDRVKALEQQLADLRALIEKGSAKPPPKQRHEGPPARLSAENPRCETRPCGEVIWKIHRSRHVGRCLKCQKSNEVAA